MYRAFFQVLYTRFRTLPFLRRNSFLCIVLLWLGMSGMFSFTRQVTRVHQASRNLLFKNRYLYFKPIVSSLSTMKTKNDFYITTPIYYVNGDPHVGHSYTSVVSDVISRYHRALGKSVHFLSGTDEHGQKVEQSAMQNNQTPIVFADTVSQKFRELMIKLGCSHNDFIRTTETRHKEAVLAFWKRLEESGDIYLGAYEGWYSIRDEAFYNEDELINGKAPTGAEVSWVKEETYFFRLSKYTNQLLQYYEDHPSFILPHGRRNEVIGFAKQEGGLRDLSISRITFKWGIPVPNNEKHVIYVWLDALTNYLSALGYPNMENNLYAQYWPADVHIVGKDILRFHAIYWPAFLMSAKLPLPKSIFAHGWWTKDGEKMSKSLGNVINPLDLIEQYGIDYIRYFFISEIAFGNDGDFSHETFQEKINADLANDIGNLLMRTISLIQKHCGGVIPTPTTPLTAEDEELLQVGKDCAEKIVTCLDQYQLKQLTECILSISKLGNKYIVHQEPWSLAKKEEERARMETILYVLAESLRRVGVYISPIIPTSGKALLDQLGVPEAYRTFSSMSESLPSGLKVAVPVPVFPKLETKKAMAAAVTAGTSTGKSNKSKESLGEVGSNTNSENETVT